MPVKTVSVGGTDEVMAPLGYPGVFYRGKRVKVRIIKAGKDWSVPMVIREALVGVEVSTIFDHKQIPAKTFNLPDGCRLAYVMEVSEALRRAGKIEAAGALHHETPSGILDMYVFFEGEYEVVP